MSDKHLTHLHRDWYGPLTRRALARSNKLPSNSFVYLIADFERVVAKIGVANDVTKRLKALQTANAGKLLLAGCLAGGRALERELHECFADDRQRGEWFRITPRMIDLIRACCEAGSGIPWGEKGEPVKRGEHQDDELLDDERLARAARAELVRKFAEVLGVSESTARGYVRSSEERLR